MRRRLVLAWALASLACAHPGARADSPAPGPFQLLIVTGLGGESYYRDLFNRWSETLLDVASERLRAGAQRITWLAADGSAAPDVTSGVATREAVLAAIDAMRARSKPGEVVAVVLIGHGTAQGQRVRFNLPGPDLAPEDLSRSFDGLGDRTVVLVNTSPSSAGFIQALAAPGRVIITATSSDAENQHTRFGGYFVSAFAEDAADRDKDRSVSLLEAFRFASLQVARAYESEGRLLTEHALLDDSGDGVGRRAEDLDARGGAQGSLAARIRFDAPASGEDGATPAGRARLALAIQARRLVDRIEVVKREKTMLDEEVYLARLESLLLELALNRRAVRAGGHP